MKEMLDEVKNIFISSAERSVEVKRKKRKKCFDEECRRMVEERQLAKRKWLDDCNDEKLKQYQNITKEIRRIIRRKEREFLERKITSAGKENQWGNTKDFNRIIYFFRKGYTPSVGLIKNKRRDLVVDDAERLNIWREYYDTLLCTQNMMKR